MSIDRRDHDRWILVLGQNHSGRIRIRGIADPGQTITLRHAEIVEDGQMREYVEDGTVTAFALWNPGDLAAWAADALITGEITGEEGDSFEAGKLGSYTVGEDGVVLLGNPYVFDAENIGDFDFFVRATLGRSMGVTRTPQAPG